MEYKITESQLEELTRLEQSELDSLERVGSSLRGKNAIYTQIKNQPLSDSEPPTPPPSNNDADYIIGPSENPAQAIDNNSDLDSFLIQNRTFGDNSNGAGLMLYRPKHRSSGNKLRVIFENCRFTNNVIGFQIQAFNAPVDLEFVNCVIAGNNLGSNSQGVMFACNVDGCDISFEETVFFDNGGRVGNELYQHQCYLGGTQRNVRVKNCISAGSANTMFRARRCDVLDIDGLLMTGGYSGISGGDEGHRDWGPNWDQRPPEGYRHGSIRLKRVIAQKLRDHSEIGNFGQFATINNASVDIGEQCYISHHQDTFAGGDSRPDSIWTRLYGSHQPSVKGTLITDGKYRILNSDNFDMSQFKHETSNIKDVDIWGLAEAVANGEMTAADAIQRAFTSI